MKQSCYAMEGVYAALFSYIYVHLLFPIIIAHYIVFYFLGLNGYCQVSIIIYRICYVHIHCLIYTCSWQVCLVSLEFVQLA